MIPFRRFIPLGLLLALFVAVGCGGGGQLVLESPEQGLREGKALFDRGRYIRASEYFQRVFDFGRAHAYAADAQYYLAQSYYNSRQYLLAANEFTRFVEYYRGDDRAEDGEFLRAMSYYNLAPPYQLDQTDTNNAITYFQLYLSRYPEGRFTTRAFEIIEELRGRLADKQMDIARLYERRKMYHAAALEYARLVDEFPDSHYAAEAVYGAMINYKLYADASILARQEERYTLALEQYRRLTQLFPNNSYTQAAESTGQEIEAAIRRLVDAGVASGSQL